jgi:2'-5' RNA ligase
MRLFVAVNFPESIKSAILNIQEDLKRSLCDVKWVNSGKFHLTLKFLGETSEDLLENVKQELEKSVKRQGSFEISLKGCGMFPDIHGPKVVWLGIGKGSEELKEIAGRIEAAMEPLGFRKEKRGFKPHLTLGRVRSLQNKTALIKKVIANEKKDAGSIIVEKIDLMQSILHPQGPEYICLKSVLI